MSVCCIYIYITQRPSIKDISIEATLFQRQRHFYVLLNNLKRFRAGVTFGF